MDSPLLAGVKTYLAQNPSFLMDWISNEADHQTVEDIAQAIKVTEVIKLFIKNWS
jgi:hypothetical protein